MSRPLERPQRPRVFSCMPARGHGSSDLLAVQSHYALASRGAVEIIPGSSMSSLLDHGFNSQWAAALNWHKAGICDYWLLHHDDIQIITPGWLDLLVSEARRVGAGVLSVVQRIKDDSGDTSTARETGDLWKPHRLKLHEIEALPETFCARDLGYHGPLLVNTGLMLVDLSCPQFLLKDEEGGRYFSFSTRTRVWEAPDGECHAQVASEDWQFSRICHRHSVPVYCTRKVECIHWGSEGYSNRPEGVRA